MIVHQLAGTNWPLALIAKPWGVCIHELTTMIQNAEMNVPAATASVATKCRVRPTRFMPNSITPRKPASRKKAVRTS